MADRKISDLTALTAPASGDYLPIVDISEAAAANKNKRITIEELFRGIPLGTAAAPSIAIEGDENTGIYSPGADQLAISTGGTERLRLDSTGQIEAVSLGTAAAPIYSFTTDPNTGIYSPGADQVAISTNGTGRLFVDASGNIIITSGSSWATSNGDFQLAFASNEAFATTYYDDHSITVGAGTTYKNKIRVSGTGANNNITFHVGASSPNERMRLDSSGRLGLGTSSPGAQLHVSAQDGTIYQQATRGTGTTWRLQTSGANGQSYELYDLTNSQRAFIYQGATGGEPGWTFSTAGTARMYINNSGNVGIGTTSPQELLHVNTGSSGGQVLRMSTNGADTGYLYQNSGAVLLGAYSTRIVGFETNGSERARIDSSGRLLVGTSSYTGNGKVAIAGGTGTNIALLDLRYNSTRPTAADTGLAEIRFGAADQTSNNAYAKIEAVTDGASSSDTDLPGRLVFSTTADGLSSPTERMRITSGGRILAGTTAILNASYLAHFSSSYGGGIWTEALGGGDSCYVSRSPGDTVGMHYAGVNDAGAIVYRVNQNGNVLNTNNSYGGISDIKLKENIVDANSQWSDIKALQVRKYNFKEGQTHTQIGLVAQEVELISPGLVSESPDRDEEGNDLGTVTKSINYSVLYMKAVKALQEAMERIEQLEAKVAVLEGV